MIYFSLKRLIEYGMERVFDNSSADYYMISIPKFRWLEWTRDKFEHESSLLFPTNVWQ
jgi:hypothetical protein